MTCLCNLSRTLSLCTRDNCTHACTFLTAESIEAANTKGTRCRPIGFCHKLTWKRKSTFLLPNSIKSVKDLNGQCRHQNLKLMSQYAFSFIVKIHNKSETQLCAIKTSRTSADYSRSMLQSGYETATFWSKGPADS